MAKKKVSCCKNCGEARCWAESLPNEDTSKDLEVVFGDRLWNKSTGEITKLYVGEDNG